MIPMQSIIWANANCYALVIIKLSFEGVGRKFLGGTTHQKNVKLDNTLLKSKFRVGYYLLIEEKSVMRDQHSICWST